MGVMTMRAMIKKGHHYLGEKYRVTPSVIAPGDTTLSDAIGYLDYVAASS